MHRNAHAFLIYCYCCITFQVDNSTWLFFQHASEHQSWEDLGYVYVSMKNEELEIDYDVLKAFYDAFEANCPQTVGECFEKFSLKIHHHLEQRMPNLEPDSSPSALLDEDDKFFLGRLGVALMYLCYSKQLFNQGYTVLMFCIISA